LILFPEWEIYSTAMSSTDMSSLTGFPLREKTGGARFSTDLPSLTGFRRMMERCPLGHSYQ
ncbi:MAG: hypothetical protein LBL24_03345, partial [Bacteroidales bacterium]|nr:hypothetical protein [Bacteroidales bacterium]